MLDTTHQWLQSEVPAGTLQSLSFEYNGAMHAHVYG